MNNILETQREFIINRLLTIGQITRNECLKRFISRLSCHIYAIKEQNPHWIIEAKTVKTLNGSDYIYKLINQDKILKMIENNKSA